jgi:DNA repair exonuclease SbcCD ATPase subunit
MAWNCINCETNNDYNNSTCEVCATERYFSISEVNDLLKIQELEPTEVKKIQTNFKRASTENKNLRQKNKEISQHLKDLEQFKEKHKPEMAKMEAQIAHLHQWNVRWKVSVIIGAVAILFLLLFKVSITFSL